jgi:hypothetical protein
LSSGPTTDYNRLVTELNKASATVAWKVSVAPADLDDAPDYSTFDTIAAGKRDSWAFLLNFPRDLTRNKTRKWITDVWGNATAGSNAESILLAGTEPATVAQNVIGGSTKVTGTVSALDRSYIGLISLNDIVEMFNA